MVASTHATPTRHPGLDFWRSLAVLWVMSLHVYFFMGFFISPEIFREILARPSAQVFLQGHFGVDIFFMLSGFLLSEALLRQLREGATLQYRKYLVSRLFRILPLYYLALLLWRGLTQKRSEPLWADIFLVSNFFPLAKQGMPWAWSLCVEMHLYLLLPFVAWVAQRFLHRPLSIWVSFALLNALSLGLNYLQASHLQLPLKIPFHPSLGSEIFSTYFNELYIPTLYRFMGILNGFFLALVLERRLLTNIKIWRGASVFIVLGVVLSAVWHRDLVEFFTQSRIGESFILGNFRNFFSLGLLPLMALSILRPFKFLSWPMWRKLSDLSYGAYLFHPFFLVVIYQMLPSRLAEKSFPFFALALLSGLSFGWAALCFRFFEMPMRNWGRKIFS